MRLEASLMLAMALTGGRSEAADDCAHRAPRQARLEAAGAESLRVLAGAGFLKIEGQSGLTAVEASGTACASREGVLDDVRLRAERRGGELYVETEIPGGDWFWSGGSRLDLTLRVPAGLRVEVEDGSGPLEIRGVASLRLDDGSGEAAIENVDGDVSVVDGSGALRVLDVGGALRVRDGSGEIELRDVGGPVTIEEDGSGAIDIQDVREGVTVRSDGSGGIDVRRVAGDLVVEDDGSGGVHYADIGGRVRLPDDE
jgi:hypothetical protein